MNLDEVLTKAHELGQATVGIALVTNQPGGTVSYAAGRLTYYPPIFAGSIFRPGRLSNSGGDPLKYYFSDRMRDVDPPPQPGGFGHSPRQPFNVDATDKLGMSISKFGSSVVVKFTLLSWQNATFAIAVTPLGDLLTGLGPSIGNQPGQAAYVVSFSDVAKVEIIH